ncbi:nicotinate-nucleotide adenylyltransferase [Enterovirga sp.]|jgi:nicotinate-nucleotide adenylyltransferase|uniref:nicotinate-nucleotide adenylyltransferase n=1 Tax=Enterovirga sp. TaxID=2026350 RepID=UPI0026188D00|nr:nicotinate-nucleotide adenylyltransferase [Enterovirga sp.]MDB5590917.1 nicotinate-nucleotide adenylyltransferase [Enterovirga sp.]
MTLRPSRRLPPHAPGMRIGLYGGSFDPPHAGHRHVALTALRRLRLDRVWWTVTLGNPLKDQSRLAARSERLAATRRIARHPRMVVTDIDAALGAVYTVDTLRFVLRRCPGVRFCWIMGADSLAGFHRWRSWREIATRVPLAVVDRPGWTVRGPRAKAAVALGPSRVPEVRARTLPGRKPPAWVLLHGPRSTLSSTALREKARAPMRRL